MQSNSLNEDEMHGEAVIDQRGNRNSEEDQGQSRRDSAEAANVKTTKRRSPRLHKTVTFAAPLSSSTAMRITAADHVSKTCKEAKAPRPVLRAPHINSADPVSYKEALARPDAADWVEAIKEELAAHAARRTWKATLLPAGRKAITCKWVFKTKLGPGPLDERKKARLVIKGFQQKEGIDYSDTFAPTVRLSSIRAALSFAAAHSWFIHQVDVNTAFLYAMLKEEIYMALPEGLHLMADSDCCPTPSLIRQGKVEDKQVVAQLLRALYGLKQAPREWYRELTKILEGLSFSPCYNDPGVYTRYLNSGIECILLVYVDDILILSPSKQTVEDFKTEFAQKVDIKDLQECRQILGIQVQRSVKGLALSQAQIIRQLLHQTGMADAAAVTCPMTQSYYQNRKSLTPSASASAPAAVPAPSTAVSAPSLTSKAALTAAPAPALAQAPAATPTSFAASIAAAALHDGHPDAVSLSKSSTVAAPAACLPAHSATDANGGHQLLNAADQHTYQSAVGTLLYVSLCTRPDISFATTVLCRSMQQATKEDEAALKHLLKYVKGTQEMALYIGQDKGQQMTAFSDSSFADDKRTFRSTMGHIIQFKGGTVSWKSQLQKTVSLSTAESEYIALSDTCKEAMALQHLLQEMGINSYKPIPIYTDNQAAKSMATATASTGRTRHINVRYHLVRDLQAQGDISTHYIPTSSQLADIFTKPLAGPAFRRAAPLLLGPANDNKKETAERQQDGQDRQVNCAVLAP